MRTKVLLVISLLLTAIVEWHYLGLGHTAISILLLEAIAAFTLATAKELIMLGSYLSSIWTSSPMVFRFGLLTMLLIQAAIAELVRRSLASLPSEPLEISLATGKISLSQYLRRLPLSRPK